MSLIDDLARLRELQGKEPLPNPHVIAGFGEGDAPPPPYIPQERPEDPYLAGDPDPEDERPTSPLIPRRAPQQAHQQATAPPTLPAGVPVPGLVVMDRIGVWKGRQVALTEADERAVRAIVLRAIKAEVDSDLALAGVYRTRRRKAKAEPEAVAPKKRGRPRKVQP